MLNDSHLFVGLVCSEDDELNSAYDPHDPHELRTPPRTVMQDPMCQASSQSCCFFNKGSSR